MVKFSLDNGDEALTLFTGSLATQLVAVLLRYAEAAFGSQAEVRAETEKAHMLVTSLRPELTNVEVEYPPSGACVSAVQDIHEGAGLRLNLMFANELETSLWLDRGRVMVLAGYVLDVVSHFDQ